MDGLISDITANNCVLQYTVYLIYCSVT